ncbi:MAG TPA: response regulator transcription factor [Roseiarcus sp.]|nr:response regulator transcription factor [Roseiarcus sp.]
MPVDRSVRLPTVLLVEDEPELADEIRVELRRRGYEVRLAPTRDEGLRAAREGDAAILILDRMLHGEDGLSIVAALRDDGIKTPVLVISALTAIDERIRGLKAGGDDYLVKPFAMGELAARVEALLRRLEDVRTTRLRVGSLEMDLVERRVNRSGRSIDLLPREFKLLEYFVRRPDQVVTRAMLLEDVWHYNFLPQTNVVDVHISNLRRKIDAKGEAPLITNIRGVGFMLHADA